MVIQRSWVLSHQSSDRSSITQASSSDDSNSSWNTQSNSTSSGPQRTTSTTNSSHSNAFIKNLADGVLHALHSRYNGRCSAQQTPRQIAEHSLDLLRLNVQDYFNDEIEKIVKKYIELYFEPALNNVRDNLGDNILDDSYLKTVSCELLENSKSKYLYEEPLKSSSIKIEYDDSSYTFQRNKNKRKDSCSSSSEHSSTEQSPTHRPIKRPLIDNNQSKYATENNQLIWNTNILSSDTLFVIDFKANRTFGLVDRDRLTNFHQDLMRYTIDNDDKEWLIEQKILLPIHRNFRIMLLILDEVKKLGQSDKYRIQTMDKLNQLIGFKIPEFMLKKIRTIFYELQKKSENLLTTPSLSGLSTSNASNESSSILNEQQSSSSSSSVIIIETNTGNNFTTKSNTDCINVSNVSTNRNLLRSSYATLSALLGGSSKDDFNTNTTDTNS